VIEEFVNPDQADTRPAIDNPPTPDGESPASPAPAKPAPEEFPSLADAGAGAAGRSLSFQFNLAKIEGQGEDSDPILRQGRELGLVAVFDGMGGAGGTVYETADGPRTGAYLASRAARDAVERRMLELLDPEWNLDGPATARELQRTVMQGLTERLSDLNAPPSGLRSRLLRALPTTMALIALQRREHGGDVWDCHLFWAGDSRAYVFQPASGAHQLTIDDIRDGGDAMTNLREDSVISNAMSADTDFVVHHREVQLTAPFLVAAATDGCFGYVPTPMHFEYLVLAALRKSHDPGSWSTALQGSIAQVTGDDASMSLLGVGADHAQFMELFADRTAQLETTCIRPLDELEAEVLGAERRLQELSRRQQQERALLWAEYKPGYEQYLASKRDA
jgi:hypothetical protein